MEQRRIEQELTEETQSKLSLDSTFPKHTTSEQSNISDENAKISSIMYDFEENYFAFFEETDELESYLNEKNIDGDSK